MRRATAGTTRGLLPPFLDRPASRLRGLASRKLLVACLLLFLAFQAAWFLRAAGSRASSPSRAGVDASRPLLSGAAPAGASGPGGAPGAPGERAIEAGQAATMLFLARDHSLVRRSVGFAWTLDTLRRSPDYRLTRAQVQTLAPLVRELAGAAREEQVTLLAMRALLTPGQLSFLNEPSERQDSRRSGPGGWDPLPSENFEVLLELLNQRLAGPGGSKVPTDHPGSFGSAGSGPEGPASRAPGGASLGAVLPPAPGRNSAPVYISRWSDFLEYPDQLAHRLLQMDADKDLAFTGEQARQVVPLLQRYVAATQLYDQGAVRFAAALTDPQLGYLAAELQARGTPDVAVVNVLVDLVPSP